MCKQIVHKINKMNIYITHNLCYNPFKIYHKQDRDAKNVGYPQSSNYQGKHPTFFSMAPKCEQRLAYASGG